ncbi:class I adenylate-forming enzyme family protein [soil metagenome]
MSKPDLLDAVLASADARSAEPALTFGRRTLSYGELAARIRAVSAGLRDEGLVDGDRVLFSVRPGPDAVVLALGIVHAGGTVVFADPGAGEALFRARAALAAPRWVAAESVLYLASSGPLRPVARRRGLELAPYARLVPDARHVFAGRWLPGVPRGAMSLATLSRTAPSVAVQTPARSGPAGDGGSRADNEQPALVIFTSGTNDAPKAVVHTRASLGAGLADFATEVGIRPGQRVLTDQLMVGVPALIAGAHWTMPPYGANPGARPEQYLALLPDAELLFAVPAALDAMLHALDANPALTPPRLDTIVVGGAPVLRPLLARIHARFPEARIRAIYGMTEILPVAIADGVAKLNAPAADGTDGTDGTDGDDVGRVVPSVTARIVDGELVLGGAGLARGYLADLPQHPLTELPTGDLARLDGDHLTLLGRRKDMFIRGTQNVYPGMYEPIIAGLPGVADAAMAGVPDGIGDDRIVLAVVPATDPPAVPTTEHPLVAQVARALPGLIDAGVLPDAVVAVPRLPRSGRSRKLDRVALAASLVSFAKIAP